MNEKFKQRLLQAIRAYVHPDALIFEEWKTEIGHALEEAFEAGYDLGYREAEYKPW